MSKENLEQFMSKVADSEELQARIGEEIDTEALIALGAECGCEFTAEAIAEYAELSDEELDGVAGGRRTREERRADRKARRLKRKEGPGQFGEKGTIVLWCICGSPLCCDDADGNPIPGGIQTP